MQLIHWEDTQTHTKGYTVDWGEEIDRGVKWLNERDPRWFDKINLDDLQLESSQACVLGQLAMTTFAEKVRTKAPEMFTGFDAVIKAENVSYAWAYSSGFNVDIESFAGPLGYDDEDRADITDPGNPDNKFIWEQLTFQWVYRIEKLRAEAGTMTG